MVVDDRDISRSSVSPHEADAPLVINPDAVVPGATASERFEAIARWHAQVGQRARLIEHAELPEGRHLNIGRQLSASLAGPNLLCLGSAKPWIIRLKYNAQRYTWQLFSSK
jgi:hypothetical protein